jgi:hypothetical protein
MASGLGRSSPDPGLGAMVELYRRRLHGSFDLTGIGKALARKSEEERAHKQVILARCHCPSELVMRARSGCLLSTISSIVSGISNQMSA